MFKELIEDINSLEGVISCKITGDEDINEIHIVASNDRKPKRIVRDIETMVLVKHDKEINHKKISIAQVNNSRETIDNNRIEIISIYQENNRPVCHLKLNINDNVVEERIEGSAEEPLPVRIARGMVDLIERYTDFRGKLRVENVFSTGINNEIVIVQLNLYNGKFIEQERLLGSVYINHDLPLATGKACLKALNRRL